MELVYETEMNEKGTAKLFLRRREEHLRAFFAPLSVLCGAIYYLFISGYTDGGGIAEFSSAILGTLIFLFGFFIVDRVVVQKVRRAYRQRKTNQVEYRLTDDKLAFTVGETTFSSPWNKVAKKFSIDRKAIYLYGKDLPFEAQCIPDWRGHGVEQKELVAILKKAGLKKMINGWLKFLMGLAVTFILITCYFYIGGIEWGDWTIPNEKELRLKLCDVPDEDNAYLALQALTNLYHVADNGQEHEKSGADSTKAVSDRDFVKYYGDPFSSEDREERAAVRSDPASRKRAEKILADNTEFFEKFRAALSLKGYAEIDKRVEDAKRAKEGKLPCVCWLPLYKPFVGFAQLVELRAQVALEKGDVESAIAAIGEIHALGQILAVNDESLVAYLVGVLIEEFSFRKMCDVVAMGKATDEVVERFSRMVAVSEANAPMAWERALKAEIAMHFETIDWICNRSSADELWSAMHSCSEDGHCPPTSLSYRILFGWPGLFKFVFHRREMLYRQAMLDRAMLAGDDNLAAMILHEIPRNPLLPNYLGNRLAANLYPLLKPFFNNGSLNRIRPRLVLAAEKWRRAHGGENPPTLDALVPYYLASVPKDPWSKSGEPIKYDATLGVAWSVGKDGKYDYRKIAKERKPAAVDSSADGDTQKYAFRLDGKPISPTSGK